MVSDTGGILPYKTVLDVWDFHEIPKTLRSILVYTPSSALMSAFFSVQVSAPYRRTGSTAVRNIFVLIFLDILDFQKMSKLCRAFHARPFLTFMSLLVEAMYDPRYLKSFTYSSGWPFTKTLSSALTGLGML